MDGSGLLKKQASFLGATERDGVPLKTSAARFVQRVAGIWCLSLDTPKKLRYDVRRLFHYDFGE